MNDLDKNIFFVLFILLSRNGFLCWGRDRQTETQGDIQREIWCGLKSMSHSPGLKLEGLVSHPM